MTCVKRGIGIDLSMDTFDVCRYEIVDVKQGRVRKYSKSFQNTVAGFKKLQAWLEQYAPDVGSYQIVMEATGVYHENLAYYLNEHGYRVSVVLPNMVKAYGKSLNESSKTDEIDAKVIAQLATERSLREWKPANPCMRRLKVLSRQRQGFVSDRTDMKNRIHALSKSYKPDADVMLRYQKAVEFFDTQIKEIEREYQTLIDSDADLYESVDNLTSIPNVALITAVAVLAQTDGFALFENRNQLTKYAGLDIVDRQSGSSVKGKSKISKQGNSHLRAALYMPSIGLVSTDTVFSRLHARVKERTGISKKGLVAMQRKLLCVMFALHRKKQKYDAEVHRLRG